MTVRDPVETPITEIELEVRDRNCFFVRLSAETDCLIRLEELIHRADGDLLQYFSIRETPPEDVLDMAASEPAIEEARLVRNGPDGNLFQFVVSGPCVTATLADTGAITHDVSATGASAVSSRPFQLTSPFEPSSRRFGHSTRSPNSSPGGNVICQHPFERERVSTLSSPTGLPRNSTRYFERRI